MVEWDPPRSTGSGSRGMLARAEVGVDFGRSGRLSGVRTPFDARRGGPMKYACLVYLVEKEMDAMSEIEAEACTDESLAYDEALRRSGQLIVAQALAPVETATTVRVRKGKLTTTDGRLPGTKDS